MEFIGQGIALIRKINKKKMSPPPYPSSNVQFPSVRSDRTIKGT